jgi:hypothetical protein
MTDLPTATAGRRLALRVAELGRALTGTAENYPVEAAALQELGRIAAEYLGLEAGPEGEDRLREPLADALALAETVDGYRRFDPDLAELLRGRLRELVRITGTVLDAAREAAAGGDREELGDLLARLAAVRARLTVADELEVLDRRAKEATARSTGAKEGQHELSRFFDAYARSERLAAEVLRAACALVLVVIAVVAALIVLHEDAAGRGVAEQLGRLSVTLPLGLLAAYAGRESNHHRQAASWSRQIAVQLRTIRLYLGELPPADRDTIQVEFATRIFAGGLGGPPPENVLDPDLGDLLEKLTGLVAAIRLPAPGRPGG